MLQLRSVTKLNHLKRLIAVYRGTWGEVPLKITIEEYPNDPTRYTIDPNLATFEWKTNTDREHLSEAIDRLVGLWCD